VLILNNLIENLRDKAYIRKNHPQVIEYSTKIKYEGYLQKIIKNKKTRKQNTLIVCKKTLDIILLYILRQILKNKKNKRNQ
jgi:hypothetical protein